MAGQRACPNCITLFVVWWTFTHVVASESIDDSTIKKGACHLESRHNKSLRCNPEIHITLTNESYVPEYAFCENNDNEMCFTCQHHSLIESKCRREAPLQRKKRFLKNIFKKIRNVPRKTIAGKGFPFLNFGKFKLKNAKLSNLWNFGSIKFNPIRPIRCPSPTSPPNGHVRCPQGTSYLKQCTYTCDKGYQLIGLPITSCTAERVFTKPPTCKLIQCGKVSVPTNAKSVTCTNGDRYNSACSPICSHGYVPARGARSVCGDNKKWTQASWACEDIVKPVFTTCPTKKINTIDKKFKWTVTATDNTGKVTLKQVQGHPPGSPMEFGVHIIKYVATDSAGNSASCMFIVELKKSDCPKPESGDSDMKFTCNGLTSQSVCHLSCTSGSFVQGSKYIACVHDTSQNNTSYWQPIDGEKATCYKKTCPTLSPPKNGALACDKQLGGTVCQIQCDDRFDVAPGEGTRPTYICGKNADFWTPSNVVPDCLEMAYPDEYSLPTEFFYFMGDCTDTQALDDIKQQFIDNLNSIGLSPCMSDECSVDDIDVTCGDMEDPVNFNFRRKRSVTLAKRVLHVRVTFHVKNSNRTLSPEAAAALLKSLADKSKNMMSTNSAMRRMLFKTLPKPTMSLVNTNSFKRITSFRKGFSAAAVMPKANFDLAAAVLPRTAPPTVKSKSVTGRLNMTCAPGYVQQKTRSGICVPCSIGTFADKRSSSCKPCPVNTYQDKAASSSCHGCPNHHTTTSTGATARDACQKLCGKDTFSLTGQVPCFPCPGGTFQPGHGGKTCLPCPPSKGPSKCVTQTSLSGTATDIQTEFRISSFLLTCDSEICLSF